MKKNRRKKKSLPPYLWAVLTLAIGFFIGFLFRFPKHPPRRQSQETPPRVRVDRAAQARHFREVIERAGGEDVWIQSAHPNGPLFAGENAFEAVVASRAYRRVLDAIRQEAHEQHLRLQETAPSKVLRATEITLYSGREPVCEWRLREAPEIARVAIVIDDLGQNLRAVQALLRDRAPLTFSVMPHLPHSAETAEEAHRAGIEVMLHLPMQPLVDWAPDVSPHEIRVGMRQKQVSQIIGSDLAAVPYAAGVNNHMGSRATSDSALMAEVMTELRRRHLFFVDSRTSANSLALRAARRAGLPAFYRSVFLDDTKSVPYTLNQLRLLGRLAQRRGAALAIGHPYPTTLSALAQFLPEMKRNNIELVPVSQLLRIPQIAHLSPPPPRQHAQLAQ
ncbi:MAG TPA: divergent polysaccharide deacetylase family protein [Terriglobia bacterium]|nr:divergent polysaccharide deacetylase family protein [Terriglobia bacterium]